ncbi:MAG: EthD family reductase [Desulfopila sp.]
MIRVSVFYPNTGPFDMDYYRTKHMGLVNDLLQPMGLIRTEVDEGISSVPPDKPALYAAVGHLIFDSLENMQKALSQHDPTFAADVPNFTGIQPQIQISKMVE